MTRSMIAITLALCVVATAGLQRATASQRADSVWEIGTGDDVPVAVAADGDGSVVVGSTVTTADASDDSGTRAYAAMLDATGRTLWTRRDLAGAVTDVTVDPSGVVTLVGTTPALSETTCFRGHFARETYPRFTGVRGGSPARTRTTSSLAKVRAASIDASE